MCPAEGDIGIAMIPAMAFSAVLLLVHLLSSSLRTVCSCLFTQMTLKYSVCAGEIKPSQSSGRNKDHPFQSEKLPLMSAACPPALKEQMGGLHDPCNTHTHTHTRTLPVTESGKWLKTQAVIISYWLSSASWWPACRRKDLC